MKILSIDTSSNICAVALLEDNQLIKELSINNGLTHSEKLMPIIKDIFTQTNMSLSDIDLLVCDKGPGSFTGIRIGVSTVMAFSDSLNIKSLGISSLNALAYNIHSSGIICSLIDAKNSNCYCGIFKLENNIYTPIEDLFFANIDDILLKLSKYSEPIAFVGNGALQNEQKITDTCNNYIISNNNDLHAYELGLAGYNAYKQNAISSVTPLYLRNKDYTKQN